ncbi:MAG: uracil-DNA glycosylase [Oscillospiraceae bacterium]|nr:uracil-DNA glycosylase [Oscillospiraceae bacterium]
MADESRFESLRESCLACTRCALRAGCRGVVFGVGPVPADLMFIGEGPGEQEDLQGEPFVGPAGKLLDDFLCAVGISRESVYIANIVKCRPPHNRDPLPEEQESCIPWLRAQTKLIAPKIIVCLGRIAAQRIIKPDFRITREHGQWVEKGAIAMTATFHPSALLRDPRNRAAAYEDFISIAERRAALYGRARD